MRYFLYHNPKITSKVLRIFLDEFRKQLLQHYAPSEVPLGYQSDSDNPVKIGGVSFIHRFGSFLNAHPHFHCVIIEGVFVKDSDSQIAFHKLSTLTEEDIQAVQERVRLRVLKSFKRSGLLEEHDVENMKTWNGGGGIFLYKELLMVRHVFMKMTGKDWKDCYGIVLVRHSHWKE